MVSMLSLLMVFWMPLCLALFQDNKTGNEEPLQCSKDDEHLLLMKESVHDPYEWCWFWTATTQDSSPFPTLSASQVTEVCDCVVDDPSLVGSPLTMNSGSTSSVQCITELMKEVAAPMVFCTWWDKSAKKGTPFKDLSRSQVNSVCKHVLATPSSLEPVTSATSEASTLSTLLRTSTTDTTSATLLTHTATLPSPVTVASTRTSASESSNTTTTPSSASAASTTTDAPVKYLTSENSVGERGRGGNGDVIKHGDFSRLKDATAVDGGYIL